MKNTNIILGIILGLAMFIMLVVKSDSISAVLFIFPFVIWPHIISNVIVFIRKQFLSQLMLLVGQAGYFIWFCYVYNDIFYENVDPQSSIGLVFVGVYAAKILIFVWIAAAMLPKKNIGDLN